MKKLSIYHTNDIHSRFEKLAGISTFLKENRTENDFFFDAGDLLDYSSPLVYGDNGSSGLELMKYLGCDLLCLGNNESFIGAEKLKNLLDEPAIPLISANLKNFDQSEISNLYKSVRMNRMGYEFLIIGINPYYNEQMKDSINVFYNLFGLDSKEPIKEIRKVIQKEEDIDFTILLSHSSKQIDEYIAENVPEIDIIVGGHSHSVIDENLMVNNCIIVQSGCYADLLGKLDIYIDEGKIVDFNSSLITNDFDADSDYLKKLEYHQKVCETNLNKTLGVLKNLDFAIEETNCSQMRYLCDLVKEEYTADLCIINNGIFNHSLEGEISKKKLLEECPSPLNPTRMKLKGSAIIQGYHRSLDKELCRSEIMGPGFRGKYLGSLSYSSNVEIIDDTLYINKEKLEEEKTYDVLTSDFLQRGCGYPMFLKEDAECKFYPLFFHEVIEKDLLNNK